jgi:cytochrome d ubiquinol oxidase subunit II
LNPFALLGGFVSIAIFVLHGLVWLKLKTLGATRERISSLFLPVWIVAVVLLCTAMLWAAFVIRPSGAWSAVPGVAVALIGLVGLLVTFRAGRFGRAFLSSALAILGTVAAAALSLFPVVIPSKLNHANDITVASAVVSDSSLTAMLIIACIGVPLVVIYVTVLYRTFYKPA